MAAYMLGYGVAAYGIGQMMAVTHLALGQCYLYSTAVALAVMILAFILT